MAAFVAVVAGTASVVGCTAVASSSGSSQQDFVLEVRLIESQLAVEEYLSSAAAMEAARKHFAGPFEEPREGAVEGGASGNPGPGQTVVLLGVDEQYFAATLAVDQSFAVVGSLAVGRLWAVVEG